MPRLTHSTGVMTIAAAPAEAAPTGREVPSRTRPPGDQSAASKEPPAFLALIEPLLPGAYRLAYAMLQGQPEAEDAVQEALIRAWRARDRLRPAADPKPWFMTIVANQCRQHRR